jgi:hypothetical protein
VIEPGGRFVGGSRSRGDEPVPALSHESKVPHGVRAVSKREKAAEDMVDVDFEPERP